jgi:hypothetical protein
MKNLKTILQPVLVVVVPAARVTPVTYPKFQSENHCSSSLFRGSEKQDKDPIF